MLRILYTVEEKGTTVFGGAARDLAWILRSLDRKRFTPAILLTGDDSFLRLLAEEKVEDIEICRLALPPWRKFKYRPFAPFVIRKLEKLIRQSRFDIIHVNGGYNDVPYATRAAHRAGIPSVFTVRNSDIIGKKVAYYNYGKADCVIVCANDQGRLLREYGIETTTIYSGVEQRQVVTPAQRGSLGIPDDALVIGSVANLVPMKGYPYLLEAMAQLRTMFPHLWLVAVGGGDKANQQELHLQAKRLGIADRVVFAGYQPSARTWIPVFDLFVLSSIWGEAATIAVLEAMAEGKAVVASAVGGVPELVVDGVTGRLVPPKSSDKLAEAIADLLGLPELRKRMGEAGRERVEKLFSFRAELENLQELYPNIVKDKSKRDIRGLFAQGVRFFV